MTLSLLAYFTYIFIDIIIYALRSTSWSSGIFWMVDQVVANPSLGLLSHCEVVPRVLILINNIAHQLLHIKTFITVICIILTSIIMKTTHVNWNTHVFFCPLIYDAFYPLLCLTVLSPDKVTLQETS
jgi:hypothetical protein